jgi:hypothetical protein
VKGALRLGHSLREGHHFPITLELKRLVHGVETSLGNLQRRRLGMGRCCDMLRKLNNGKVTITPKTARTQGV